MVGVEVEVILESNLTGLDKVSTVICEILPEIPVCLLYGELGAGKTTLVKKIMEELGAVDAVSSPTFSIINEYITKDNQPCFHMDLYRVESLQEALDLGIMEYLDSGKPCLIEWPEVIRELLDSPYVEVTIEDIDKDSRQYQIKKYV